MFSQTRCDRCEAPESSFSLCHLQTHFHHVLAVCEQVACGRRCLSKEACEGQFSRMLQLCKVTKHLFISNARSVCSDELIQQEAVTLCINVSKQQPFPSAGIKKLQVPIYDDIPNEDLYGHFDRCADAIQKEANRGGRSVVYCKNGRSRSATVCIAYLMKHRKLTLTDALQVGDV
ncbi:hypothetical protein L3Q82_006002 [Scortum barcoo]|uniref:Uncharacterized protein n=1 Tax=Scortum barcoo TaxID=214431 RepID=A0ACB8X5D0_9TELE|nr:hypothetical protein L3Q82_006002 [Scortum barcoo]